MDSFIDLILGQQMILVSAGVALLLMWAAFALVAAGRVRSYFRNRPRKQVVESEKGDVLAGLADAFEYTDDEDIEINPGEDAPAEEEQSIEGVQQISAEMNDILSSVFVDEGVAARYELLLRDSDGISAADLLVLTNDLAEKLGIDLDAVKAKEQAV